MIHMVFTFHPGRLAVCFPVPLPGNPFPDLSYFAKLLGGHLFQCQPKGDDGFSGTIPLGQQTGEFAVERDPLGRIRYILPETQLFSRLEVKTGWYLTHGIKSFLVVGGRKIR
jgi:hypothetical protein